MLIGLLLQLALAALKSEGFAAANSNSETLKHNPCGHKICKTTILITAFTGYMRACLYILASDVLETFLPSFAHELASFFAVFFDFVVFGHLSSF